MGTGSFQGAGVKRPGRGVDHPPPSNAEVKERVELYLYSTSGSSWPVTGQTFTVSSEAHVSKQTVAHYTLIPKTCYLHAAVTCFVISLLLRQSQM
jgi:hypothetical protein